MTKDEIHNHIKSVAEYYVSESWNTFLDLDEIDLIMAGIGVGKIIADEQEKRIEELEQQIEKMKCYLPVDERDSNHKWFAYKNLFDTEWNIDYLVQGELPKCNTIKWFENKEAVMFYLVSNGMKYYEEPRR